MSLRKDWNLIESMIEDNSRVLDIGCGEGGLISQLQKNTKAKTNGIEVNGELARKAIAKGFNVIQGNAENRPAIVLHGPGAALHASLKPVEQERQ